MNGVKQKVYQLEEFMQVQTQMVMKFCIMQKLMVEFIITILVMTLMEQI